MEESSIVDDEEAQMEAERDGSSSDEGVGAGSNKKYSSASSSSSKKSKKSVATSSHKNITKSDQEWPKDIPSNFTCLRHCNNTIRAAMHQGYFEICWAVALARCMEALFKLKHEVEVHLSPQHLVNNIRNMNIRGKVTKYNEVRHFLVNHGLVEDKFCPFSGKINQNCPKSCQNCAGPTYKIKELVYMKTKEVNEEELFELVQSGPVVAVVDAYKSFVNYKDGIYKGKMHRKDDWVGRHAVLVIGFNTTPEGVNYWIIQNSWGPQWGQNGTGMIIRKSSLDVNELSLFKKIIKLVV